MEVEPAGYIHPPNRVYRFDAENRLFRNNHVSITVSDDLGPCVAISSAPMKLIK